MQFRTRSRSKRRIGLLIALGATLALVLVLPALAVTNPLFRGPVAGGANNAGVEMHANFADHVVNGFGWFNVPVSDGATTCTGSGKFPNTLHIRRHRRFHGSHTVRNTAYSATITGQFNKKHTR